MRDRETERQKETERQRDRERERERDRERETERDETPDWERCLPAARGYASKMATDLRTRLQYTTVVFEYGTCTGCRLC